MFALWNVEAEGSWCFSKGGDALPQRAATEIQIAPHPKMDRAQSLRALGSEMEFMDSKWMPGELPAEPGETAENFAEVFADGARVSTLTTSLKL